MVGAIKGKSGAVKNASGRFESRAFAVCRDYAPDRLTSVSKAMAGQREVGYA